MKLMENQSYNQPKRVSLKIDSESKENQKEVKESKLLPTRELIKGESMVKNNQCFTPYFDRQGNLRQLNYHKDNLITYSEYFDKNQELIRKTYYSQNHDNKILLQNYNAGEVKSMIIMTMAVDPKLKHNQGLYRSKETYYDLNNKTLSKSKFDSKGQLVKKDIYNFSELNYNVSEEGWYFESSDKKLAFKHTVDYKTKELTVRQYDEEGRVILKSSFHKTEDSAPYKELVYIYSDQTEPKVITRKFKHKDGYTYIHEFDEDQLICLKLSKDNRLKYEEHYNEDKDITLINWYENNKVVQVQKFENRCLVSDQAFDVNGNLQLDKQYLYDGTRLIVEEHYKDGQLIYSKDF